MLADAPDEQEAWRLARSFASAARGLLGDDLLAVFVIGSLASRGYRRGRSDIDTAVIVRTDAGHNWRPALRQLADDYHERFAIPKGFGAVVMDEAELWPPYDPEKELAPEVLRVIRQGVLVEGAFDREALPEPSREDLIAFAKVFYAFLRGYSEERTPDAFVNTILYELRLVILNETGDYVLDKRDVVPRFLNVAEVDETLAELEAIHRYIVEGEGIRALDLPTLLSKVVALNRVRVPWA